MMLTMGRIPGVGLAKGLSITLRHMLRKSVTQQYPEVQPALPPRSRGVIALVEENCTSCMLCARECPDWCIYIDSHKETIPAPEGGRPRQRNVLDRFAIDFSLCMYCGICIEVCPFDALFWSPEFEYAEGDIRNLLHEKDRLAAWTPTVPPPPAHDPGAEPPKELTAAPRRPTSDRASRAAADRVTPGAAERPAGRAADRPAPGAPDRPSRTATERRVSSTGHAPDSTGRPAEPSSRAAEDTGPASPAPRDTGSASPGPREEPTSAPTEEQPSDVTEDGTGPITEASPTGQQPPQAPSTGQQQPEALSTGQQPQEPASSTGEPSSEKLSTARHEPPPRPGPAEQTSPASPRKRRMADPRSIRPPGRLGPGETRESEEES
jgi:formate hydrogenlyase subunit 6/NADH:ubiquinone oxidoreductase subunit I